ncbi:hypothetical protein D3C72_1686630 [compost metagenome]
MLTGPSVNRRLLPVLRLDHSTFAPGRRWLRAKHLTEVRRLVGGLTGCRMTTRRAKCSSFNSTNSILIRQLRRIEEFWSGGWAICCLIATFPHLRQTAVDSSSRRLEGRAKSVARLRPAMTYQTGQEQVIAGSALNAIGLIHVQRTCIRKLWPSSGLRFLGRRPIPVSRYSLALRRQGKANASSCEPACALHSNAHPEDRNQSSPLRVDLHAL